jgi:hypothetical protein
VVEEALVRGGQQRPWCHESGEAEMISLTSVTTIFGAFKSIKDAADSIVTLRDEHLIMGKVAEINSKLIDAQNGIFAVNEERSTLVQTVSALEGEISDLKTWNTEKQRYELVPLAPNVMAYQLKAEERRIEPVHLLCANCYTDGTKSFLNQTIRGPSLDRFKCNRCSEELSIHKDRGPLNALPPNTGRGGPNSWMGR